jgi:hypothetical protein
MVEKTTAEHCLNEVHTVLHLCEYQYEQAEKKLQVAEYCVGEVRVRLHSQGLLIYYLPSLSDGPSSLSCIPVGSIESDAAKVSYINCSYHILLFII